VIEYRISQYLKIVNPKLEIVNQIMPIYHKLGKIPPKRHTQFEQSKDGIYYEQLFGTVGFEGMSSLMYEIYRPTMVKEILSETDVNPIMAVQKHLKARLLKGFEVAPKDDFWKVARLF
jgi:homogentisate 1,2-dioxygenase